MENQFTTSCNLLYLLTKNTIITFMKQPKGLNVGYFFFNYFTTNSSIVSLYYILDIYYFEFPAFIVIGHVKTLLLNSVESRTQTHTNYNK